ncbi:hypothetical protein HMPREF0293_1944 [Corynebacterium glucuronolyticum ATCC 51866]|uniref:Uncharacterized protein n=1 Tax=Corynebacterium glucuronolyticum ATCC 51866 TaxID=548478 RepID=A0ABM9XNQ8_9CORY|nr:hypothetical protein HMPREF0293_1944 [Corynebacterium glucuronolyticum ATCC 51866]
MGEERDNGLKGKTVGGEDGGKGRQWEVKTAGGVDGGRSAWRDWWRGNIWRCYLKSTASYRKRGAARVAYV